VVGSSRAETVSRTRGDPASERRELEKVINVGKWVLSA